MSQRDMLIRELKQWVMPLEPGQAWPTNADAISPATLNGLRSILIEIEESSVLVAITTSIAGALAHGRGAALTVQHLATYLPPNPDAHRRHIEIIAHAALGPSLVLPIQAYYARLSYALRISRALVDAGPAPSNDVRMGELAKVEDAWRHVCGTALAAISVLRDTLAAVRYSRPPVANEHAEALLRSAKSGSCPCVSENGLVRMPRWAEGRAHARHVTQIRAMAFLPDFIQPIVIENASRTGLGLSGLPMATPGSALTVAIESGERLSGQLMWVRGERAGMKLDDMLPADHHLLAAPIKGL